MKAADLDLPTLVSLAGATTVTRLVAQLREAGFDGVRPSHGYVIQRLVDDEPTTSALAEALGMTAQGASKHVQDLVRRGFVERVPGDTDARVRIVRLTPHGRALLDAARRARSDLEAALLDRVGPRRLTTTRTVLGELLDLLGVTDRIESRSVPLPEA
jgi:DNA-binding MarR family transcriptional regulator